MKTFYLCLAAVVVSLNCSGVHWEIIGQDSKKAVHRGSLDIDLKTSVGATTIRVLDENKIPYVGNEDGINSLLGTPTGDAAIVVVSADTMRVYGWCYEVDGIQPNVMPGEFYFPTQASTLRWFFAYSLYEKGEWKDYCTPAHTKPLR